MVFPTAPRKNLEGYMPQTGFPVSICLGKTADFMYLTRPKSRFSQDALGFRVLWLGSHNLEFHMM